jgi:hypothetical protein
MTTRNKCKWCGVEGSKHAVSYRCGSWHDNDRKWSQGIACRDLCEQLRQQHEQTINILRKRINAAINRADGAKIFAMPYSNIICVRASDLDDVVEILRGNSPINLEGSP